MFQFDGTKRVKLNTAATKWVTEGDFSAGNNGNSIWHDRCVLVVSDWQVSRLQRNGTMFANVLMLVLFYIVLVVPVLWVLQPSRVATPF